MTNKIHFVGAGPGDKELITLKGYKLLSNADIVIYAGSLVNPELLEYCKEGCEIHNSAHMDLQEIIDVMARGIREDKSVVRLQTGDFSIYGSIREQVEELFKLDIDYDCTPGVSSFLGAASALGVEYTVPEISQSVIITRMEGRTPVPSKESIESYAQHQTSMAIFLSVHDIEKVVERNDDALDLINKNVEKFNLKNVEVIKAYAPIDIEGEADAIFLGGTGNRLDEILLWSKEKLVPGGRLVANFIIVETFNETLRLLREYGFENIDVSVMNISKLEKLGRGEYFKPLNPIYIISCEKGRE